jgi:CubicO group peptidase (beta-lactamase class C family)
LVTPGPAEGRCEAVAVRDLARRVARAAEEALGPARVPGAALATVERGEIAWVGAVGDVAADARFQAGSVSKALAAVGVLRLVRETRADLDAPLVPSLGGWCPPGAPPGMEDGITLRRVLSHTAGLSIPAYPGLEPGEPLPDTVGLLRGEGDAGPVRLVARPGTTFRYSGGGFTVAQHWAELAAGMPFAQLMDELVLRPLGMSASTFRQTPADHDATPHDAEGAPMPAYRHAALAAAGLLTTAEDLARFAAAICAAAVPEGMATPAPVTDGRYGLGLELGLLGQGLAGHSGQNRGWRALVAARRATGAAVVVLCNGDGGDPVRRAALAQLVE